MADDVRLQHLVSQAKAAIAREDRQELGRIFDDIYALTTGFDPVFEESPEHLSNPDYQNKLCPYRKATAPLMTTEDIEYLHHKTRIAAFGIVHKKEENAPYVLAIIECVQDNGEPVPEALALREGIKWARKLEAADAAKTQTIAREYDELVKRHPDNQLYQVLSSITNLYVDSRRLDDLAKETNQLRTEDVLYQANLVEKADKGDLAVQLEVARRLESGDKFRQNNHFAYFWYKRALQNGGGEVAQSGMDKLRPLLDEIDLMRVDNWLKKKYHPY